MSDVGNFYICCPDSRTNLVEQFEKCCLQVKRISQHEFQFSEIGKIVFLLSDFEENLEFGYIVKISEISEHFLRSHIALLDIDAVILKPDCIPSDLKYFLDILCHFDALLVSISKVMNSGNEIKKLLNQDSNNPLADICGGDIERLFSRLDSCDVMRFSISCDMSEYFLDKFSTK